MKLTLKQIEAERVKFMKWFKLYDIDPPGINIEYMLDAWLACRESIEIELPEKVSVGFGTNRSFTYVLIDDLISKLESQGFTVVAK